MRIGETQSAFPSLESSFAPVCVKRRERFHDSPAPQHPRAVGPYRILRVLGEGGFGIVYLAREDWPPHRLVALKIVRPGLGTAEVLARFALERDCLSALHHPNIVGILDAGVTSEEPGSRPYVVMEFVEGEPITDYCDERRLDIRARLELFGAVCDAVHHAHTRGLIHRDLKPSNVLVSGGPTGPVPKVIDFGLAKAVTGASNRTRTCISLAGQVLGTPEYMSPEQAEGGSLGVDARTDVYSLGVLLYQLLSGLLPFDPLLLRRAGCLDAPRIIRDLEPLPPSQRLSRLAIAGTGAGDADKPVSARILAGSRQATPRALIRQLRAGLERIPLKAMSKDRARRYRSARDLADDVRNYLAGKPLAAGQRSRASRPRGLHRHRRAYLAFAAAIALAALLAIITGTANGRLGPAQALASAVDHSPQSVQAGCRHQRSGSLCPHCLNAQAFQVVSVAGSSHGACQSALAAADLLVQSQPTNPSFAVTLGAARYRLGSFADSIATLAQAGLLRGEATSDSASALAFASMSHHRLGQPRAARERLLVLRDLMQDPRLGQDPLLLRLQMEAEVLVSTPAAGVPTRTPGAAS